MKPRLAIVTAVGLAAGLVTACGDDHTGVSTTPAPPPMSTNQALDTAQVLAVAKVTSETSSPFPVAGGALTLTDASETTEPINVNAM